MKFRNRACLLLVSMCVASPVWGQDISQPEFRQRIAEYDLLRNGLAGSVTSAVTSDATQLDQARSELAIRIREARTAAAFGDFFTRDDAHELVVRLRQRLDRATWAAVMDENPGEFPFLVQGAYPGERPLSSVPSSLLAVLPQLPDGLEYRFVGRHLILLDTRANLILDYIPYALASCDCGHADSTDE